MSDLNATLFVRPGTWISVDDRPLPDVEYRVIVIHIDDLTMHIDGDDEDIVTTTNRLIDALTTLRDNAQARLAEGAAVA